MCPLLASIKRWIISSLTKTITYWFVHCSVQVSTTKTSNIFWRMDINSCSTFSTLRPHFDALAKVGYFKIVLRDRTPTQLAFHYAFRVIIWTLVISYNLQHLIKVVQVWSLFLSGSNTWNNLWPQCSSGTTGAKVTHQSIWVVRRMGKKSHHYQFTAGHSPFSKHTNWLDPWLYYPIAADCLPFTLLNCRASEAISLPIRDH